MTESESQKLLDAVRTWTGHGQSSWPSRDDVRVQHKFGDANAAKLLPIIKNLERDFYSSNAQTQASDLAAMEQRAKAHFIRLHPDLPEEIADIFAWCLSFDFK